MASPAKRFHFKEKFNFLFYDKRFSLADNIEDNRCQKNHTFNNLLDILVNTHDTHTKIQNTHQKCTNDNTRNCTGTTISRSTTNKSITVLLLYVFPYCSNLPFIFTSCSHTATLPRANRLLMLRFSSSTRRSASAPSATPVSYTHLKLTTTSRV